MSILSRIASSLRIRIHVHSTWYFACILMTGVLVTWFPEDYPFSQRILLGFLGSLVFFVSIAIRQVLLSLLAVIIGIPLKNVTLFVFGGTSQVPEDSTRPSRELAVGITGLLLNQVIAMVFNWFYIGQTTAGNAPTFELLRLLAFFWYMLAFFHFAPGFPLAAGEILHAIIWKSTKNYLFAMRITTWIGWLVGLFLIIYGIYMLVLSGETVNGPLLIFLGWTLQVAARQSRRRATLLHTLQYTRAEDIVTREFPVVPPESNLARVIRDYLLVKGQDYFCVSQGSKLLGIVTASNIKHRRKKLWDVTPVSEVMTPVKKVKIVQASQSAAQLLELMNQSRADVLPVMENDELIGIVVRERLLRLARVRADLKI